MQTDHFAHMTMALEIEDQSAHPLHKVGALLCGLDKSGQPFMTARANFWPPALEQKIGRDEKLGNASTTVHAEFAAICSAPATEGASLYISDLPCPNCAKAMAEAGIAAVYIDSHTHNTPLGLKIKPFFDDISLPILRCAGIAVYEMDVATHEIKEIAAGIAPAMRALERNPVRMIALSPSEITREHFILTATGEECQMPEPYAACIACDDAGNAFLVCAGKHPSIGLDEERIKYIKEKQDKYLPTLEPLNRLLLNCVRGGLHIIPDYIYSSQTPTSREFVNLIGTGHLSISIGNKQKSRDPWGMTALDMLKKRKILTVW